MNGRDRACGQKHIGKVEKNRKKEEKKITLVVRKDE